MYQSNTKEDIGNYINKDTIREDRECNKDGEQGHRRAAQIVSVPAQIKIGMYTKTLSSLVDISLNTTDILRDI